MSINSSDRHYTNWRAVCGKTACTVRKAGKSHFPHPIPILDGEGGWNYKKVYVEGPGFPLESVDWSRMK